MEKNEIREELIDFRNKLSIEIQESKSIKIQNQILQSELYLNCENFCCYINYNSEVKTDYLIKRALLDDKNVYVPKIRENHIMDFIKINLDTKFEKNKYGIEEPILEIDTYKNTYENGVFIVPGVAFDKSNYRIGYGGGFYDNWIAQNPKNIYIGICYDFQIIDDFTKNKYDKKMDYVFFK